MTSPTPTPATAAGRKLLEHEEWGDCQSHVLEDILAIEAEAAAAAPERAALEVLVEAFLDRHADLDAAIKQANVALAAAPERTALNVERLAWALHHLHSVELWSWWEPQPDGGALVRRGTSPELAAAIAAAYDARAASPAEGEQP